MIRRSSPVAPNSPLAAAAQGFRLHSPTCGMKHLTSSQQDNRSGVNGNYVNEERGGSGKEENRGRGRKLFQEKLVKSKKGDEGDEKG